MIKCAELFLILLHYVWLDPTSSSSGSAARLYRPRYISFLSPSQLLTLHQHVTLGYIIQFTTTSHLYYHHTNFLILSSNNLGVT
jgi:hypothetical protein